MNRPRLWCLVLSVLLSSFVLEVSPGFAQGDGSPHAAIIAKIPTLENFAAQAENTFVGEVETSYAYIAFVVQDDFAVIYVCDDVMVSAWIRAEVVDGVISVTTDTGLVIEATVTDSEISGTIVLPIDDDGTPPTSHNFSTTPAIPGVTGLARAEDDLAVSGWIVTENGIRGAAQFKGSQTNNCANLTRIYNETRATYTTRMLTSPGYSLTYPEARDAVYVLNAMRDNLIAMGCTGIPAAVSLSSFYHEQP